MTVFSLLCCAESERRFLKSPDSLCNEFAFLRFLNTDLNQKGMCFAGAICLLSTSIYYASSPSLLGFALAQTVITLNDLKILHTG